MRYYHWFTAWFTACVVYTAVPRSEPVVVPKVQDNPVSLVFACSVKPTLIWAQRKDRILLTVDIVDIRDEKITLEEKTFSFSGVGRGGVRYECQFELRNEVIPQESKQSKTARGVYLSIKKKEAGPYWSTLATTKLPYLKVDFNKWKDEDESDDEEDPYEDGLQNLMQRMDMGGAPSTNGTGFDPGDDSDSDSDDEPIPGLS